MIVQETGQAALNQDGLPDKGSPESSASTKRGGVTQTPYYSYTGYAEFLLMDNELDVYFKENSRENYIALQLTSAMVEPAKGNYHIDIYKYGIVLKNLTTYEVYFYGISSQESDDLYNDLQIVADYTDKSAAGLIYLHGDTSEFEYTWAQVMSSGPLLKLILELKKLLPGPDGRPNCDSGGQGASGCSTTTSSMGGTGGCSATCRENFYACCNNAGLLSSASCRCYLGM